MTRINDKIVNTAIYSKIHYVLKIHENIFIEENIQERGIKAIRVTYTKATAEQNLNWHWLLKKDKTGF